MAEGDMALPKIKHLRAFVVRGGGADHHDQAPATESTIIATPMARYPDIAKGIILTGCGKRLPFSAKR